MRDALHDLREEQVETKQEINDALYDGVVTPQERQNIREERAEDIEAAGDAVEQAGDVIQERND